MNKKYFSLLKAPAALITTLMLGLTAGAQNSYTFTSCGVTGDLGPNQTQVNTAYAGTSLQGSVTSVSGIQNFTVPATGMYRVELYGASGGTNALYSGYGAYAAGDVSLTAGSVVQVLVGQMGSNHAPSNSDGGGGGSFVVTGGTLLFAAGGGGGAAQSSVLGQNAQTVTAVVNGAASQFGSSGASYSVNGTNFTYGTYTTVAQAFTNGGNGQGGGQAGGWPGIGYGDGGFGGGGSSCSCSTGGGGGGGGFIGGGGGACCYTSGYGGSSYTISTAQNVSLSVLGTLGDGKVIITSLCNNAPSPAVDMTQANNYTVCPNKTTTLSATGAGTITWFPTSTSSVVIATGTDAVTPNTLTAGTYSLWAMVTNTCSSSTRTPITFTVLAPPAVNIATLGPVCSGYTVSLTANGANSYSWSNGATTSTISAQANGQYTVVGTDAVTGCTNSAVSSLSVYPAPSLTITGPSTVCAGTNVTLTASGGDTYFWNIGSASPSIALAVNSTTLMSLVGTFTMNGCTATVQKSITAYPNPALSVSGATTICAHSGITLTLTASGATSYFWSTGANSSSIVVTPSVSTNYSVVGVFTTACTSSAAAPVTVMDCTGIKTNGAGDKGISVYPNPASLELTIECKNGTTKNYEIYDLTGRAVIHGSSDKDQTSVDISSLARGLYYIKVSSANGDEIFKIVKQ
jgi:hypothetical protein